MTQEMKNYLLNQIDNKYHNYIFVDSLDEQVEQFLKDRNGSIGRKTRTEWLCTIDGMTWYVKPLSLGCRGYKSRRLIVDMRIPDELLHDSCLVYNLIVCQSIEVF
ncbi:MAG: hypothetical protein K2P12_01035 [Clostridia bacterium]|nr:hypothetical protein [Clostridia bacterium]